MQAKDYFLSYDELIAFKFMTAKNINNYLKNKYFPDADNLGFYDDSFIENLFDMSYSNITQKRISRKKINYLFDFTKSHYYDSVGTMKNKIKFISIP